MTLHSSPISLNCLLLSKITLIFVCVQILCTAAYWIHLLILPASWSLVLSIEGKCQQQAGIIWSPCFLIIYVLFHFLVTLSKTWSYLEKGWMSANPCSTSEDLLWACSKENDVGRGSGTLSCYYTGVGFFFCISSGNLVIFCPSHFTRAVLHLEICIGEPCLLCERNTILLRMFTSIFLRSFGLSFTFLLHLCVHNRGDAGLVEWVWTVSTFLILLKWFENWCSYSLKSLVEYYSELVKLVIPDSFKFSIFSWFKN